MTAERRVVRLISVLATPMLVVMAAPAAWATPAEPTEQRTDCATVSAAAPNTAIPAAQLTLRFSDVWGLTRGGGQTVAVIDTGVAPHPSLPGLRPGGDYVSDGDGLDDCDAHGTIVAGLIAAQPVSDSGFAGGAPDADILSIRQSSAAFSATSTEQEENDGSTSSGYGDVDSMALAVRAAVDAGAGIVNISEVACAPVGTPLGDDALDAAIRYAAVEKDAVIVAAAGNLDGQRCREQNGIVRGQEARAFAAPRTVASPARFDDHVLTVASLNTDGRPSDFSLAGPWVDIAAPGTDVTSLSPTGAGLTDGTVDAEGLRSPYNGTSFAAPYVSATAALIRSRYPEMAAADVVARIVRTAHAPADGWDSAVGFGSLDPVAAVTGTAAETASPPPRHLDARVDAPRPDRSNAVIAVIGSGAAFGIVLVVSFVRAMFRRQDPS